MYTFVAFESVFGGDDLEDTNNFRTPQFTSLFDSQMSQISAVLQVCQESKALGLQLYSLALDISAPRAMLPGNNQRPQRSLTTRWMFYNSFRIFFWGLFSRCGIGKVATRILRKNCLCSKSSLNCYFCEAIELP